MKTSGIATAATTNQNRTVSRSTRKRSRQRSIVGQCSTALLILLLWAAPAHAQAIGTAMPWVAQQWSDNSGNPCNACKLYTYASGTTTPLSTYSDVALTTANANPVILDAAGRATVYVSAASYKFVLKSSADATIWTRDAIASVALSAASRRVSDGRLTLSSVTPVTRADVTAATTVYFTPYNGNEIALYDGTAWAIFRFAELSLSLGTDAADTNYDVFAYNNAGVVAIERLAWTSASARASPLALQDGVYVKSGTTTRRYLGTYRTTGTIGQTEDSTLKRFVWNQYNRAPRSLAVRESTDSWTYTLATFRQANNSTANQVAFVIGNSEVRLDLRLVAMATNSVGATGVAVAIGEDSTTAAMPGSLMQNATAQSGIYGTASAHVSRMIDLGYHYYTWLEFSAASGTTTWYGDSGAPTNLQTGMAGFIDG